MKFKQRKFYRHNLKTIGMLTLVFVSFINALQSQSSIDCDFSNADNKRSNTFKFWDIENKIFSGSIPSVSESVVDNGGRSREFNFIRTLGGWKVRGADEKDFSGDLATYQNGQYIFEPKQMIDKIKEYQSLGIRIHQIVLDNPPWVFQRGLTFVDNIDNINYLKSTEIETYGNAIPPNNNYQWRLFVRTVMDALVLEFGQSTVANWQFRGGSEIETPGHWAGTKEQYFNHYRTIVEEVKRAVPNAKVGAHFREANYVSNRKNYKNQTIKSFSSDFFDWTKTNDVPYDFIGVSYYPFFDRLDGGLGGLNVFDYYDEGIKPFRDNPNFNQSASIEIHEFWLFTNFGNGLLVNVGTSHGAAFMLKLARLAYERDISKINQWGYGQIGRLLSPERMGMKMLGGVVGQTRYKYTGNFSTSNKNTIDALFTTTGSGDNRRYNAILSNYNDSPEYLSNKEKVVVNMQLPVATGKNYEYRIVTYGKDQCGFNKLKDKSSNYRSNENQEGWIKNGANATYGHIEKSIGGSGMTRRNRLNRLEVDANSLQQYNNFQKSNWIEGTTKNINGTNSRSRLTVVVNLESFMLQKIEVRLRPGRNASKIASKKEATDLSNVDVVFPSVSVYPNPVNENLNISIKGLSKANITISNILGKLFFKQTTTNSDVKIPIDNKFKQGVYFVKVIGDDGNIFKNKFIVK